MAAISSTTATVCISQKNFYTPSPKRNSLLSHSINSYFPTRPRKQLTVRNTGDVSAETGSTEIEPEARSDPSSLISALNVERALRGIGNEHHPPICLCTYQYFTLTLACWYFSKSSIRICIQLTKFLFRMQQLQTRIIMADLNFEEGVHLMRSILKSAFSFFFLLTLSPSHCFSDATGCTCI